MANGVREDPDHRVVAGIHVGERRTIAAPIPREPPVTTVTFPACGWAREVVKT